MLHNSREKNGNMGLYPVLYGCEEKRDGSLKRTDIPWEDNAVASVKLWKFHSFFFFLCFKYIPKV